LKHKSIKIKILLYFGIISFLLLTVFTVSFYLLLKQNNISTIKHKLHMTALKIDETNNYKNIKSKFPFMIIQNDTIIYKSGILEIKDLKKYINSSKDFFIINVNNNSNVLYILKDDSFSILVAQNNFDDNVEDFINYLVLLEIFLFILLIFLANNILNKILDPIKQINKTAKEITINNINSHIKIPNSGKEIDELVNNFNHMIDRLKSGIERIDRFNSDVSHELKTPLTIIDMQIELAFKKERNNEYYKKSLITIKSEIDKIKNITEELLLITKYDKQNIKNTFLLCDFNNIFLDILEKYILKAEKKKINIQIKKFEAVKKETNCFLINTVFTNIIDNAVKYTPNGKNIYISLFSKDKKIYFIVKDEGIGIPDNKIDKITQRFYRVDESRNKSVKGFGLGLSIVKNSLDLLDGELQITSEIEKGTIVKVIL